MSGSSSAYKISKTTALLLVLLVGALLVLNASLIIQNRRMRGGETNLRSTVLKRGSTVPALAGTDLDGKDFTLDYGKDPRKAVMFIFSPRCGICTKNMANWKAISQRLDRNSYRIVAVSIVPEGVKEYINQQRLTNVPVIAEVDPKSRVSYEMNVTPITLLIDSKGQVEKVWVGLLLPEEQTEVEQVLSLKLPATQISQQVRP